MNLQPYLLVLATSTDGERMYLLGTEFTVYMYYSNRFSQQRKGATYSPTFEKVSSNLKDSNELSLSIAPTPLRIWGVA